MNRIKKALNYFTRFEKLLWSISVTLICVSFFGFGMSNYLTLVTSLIGVTSLIFNAKGNPIGPALIIIFGIIYGIISFQCKYYGEMLTYVGMSVPMSVFALVSWLRNPHSKGSLQVRINRVGVKEMLMVLVLALGVTAVFHFILKTLGTANLLVSTLSVTTSFVAVYLTYRRTAEFALAYAANDLVLIALWSFAAIKDISYLAVVICFTLFIINDTYTFICWKRMYRAQNK